MASNGIRLSDDVAIANILLKCKERNYEFIGFNEPDGKYHNHRTLLILKCNKCGNIWDTTSYQKFVKSNHGCSMCSKYTRLTHEEAMTKIYDACERNNFTFIGFDDETKGYTKRKVILKCNKCGRELKPINFQNFVRRNKMKHNCSKTYNINSPNNSLSVDQMKETAIKASIGTNLEFIEFENGIYERLHAFVLYKCKKCGEISRYAFRNLNTLAKPLSCKFCERTNKYSNEEAFIMAKDAAEKLGFTFLGFEGGKYSNKKTKVILQCNKCGRKWDTTQFNCLIHRNISCVKCKNNWKMESTVFKLLTEKNIKFEHGKRYPWLKNKIAMQLDFYIPSKKIAIECQGLQHYHPSDVFGGDDCFEETRKRDIKKLQLCEDNNIELLYFDDESNNTSFLGKEVIKNKEKLLEKIL